MFSFSNAIFIEKIANQSQSHIQIQPGNTKHMERKAKNPAYTRGSKQSIQKMDIFIIELTKKHLFPRTKFF